MLNSINENELRDMCANYVSTHSNLSNFSKYLKNRNLFDIIDNWESEKISDYPFCYKLFWFIHNKHDFDKCKICGKRLTTKIKDYVALESKPVIYCSSKCANSDTEFVEKRKTTMVSKYGVDNPSKSKEICDKRAKTIFDKFGEMCFFKTDKFKETMKEKCVEICGEVEPTVLKTVVKDEDVKTKINEDKKLVKENHKKTINVVGSNIHNYMKTDIIEFIKSIYSGEVIEGYSSGLSFSVDVYIPEKHLAFDFDDLTTHNDDVISSNYHLLRLDECEKNNIHLINIFETEWVVKSDIVKSRIKNLLGIYDKTIYARKCEVKEIPYKVAREFLDNSHIQGGSTSKINVGLFYENELVSVMTFGKTRFSKMYEYELMRFANKMGYHIPGSASKLLKYFERNYNPSSLMSYADRRWSSSLVGGTVYEKLGLKLVNISQPNYFYFKNNTNTLLESRVKYQKHKLHLKLEIFDAKLTEVENMKNNDYKRIFDCGNFVLAKVY